MPPATVTRDALVEADEAGLPVKTSACHTGTLIASLPAPAQAAVLLALTAKDDAGDLMVPSTKIVAVLEQHGLPVRAENLNRHRRRLNGGGYACKCRRPDEATRDD